MNATERINHLDSRVEALKVENDRLKARPHTTHHDDCGCKSAWYEATIAELLEALEEIRNLQYGWEGDCGAIRIAEDAIDKAKEQSK